MLLVVCGIVGEIGFEVHGIAQDHGTSRRVSRVGFWRVLRCVLGDLGRMVGIITREQRTSFRVHVLLTRCVSTNSLHLR